MNKNLNRPTVTDSSLQVKSKAEVLDWRKERTDEL